MSAPDFPWTEESVSISRDGTRTETRVFRPPLPEHPVLRAVHEELREDDAEDAPRSNDLTLTRAAFLRKLARQEPHDER